MITRQRRSVVSTIIKHATNGIELRLLAFGDNRQRMTWLHKLMNEGFEVPVLIHPHSHVAGKVGAGTIIEAGAIVYGDVGQGCIISLSAIIDHDSVVEDGVHCNAGSIIGSHTRVPALTKIGYGKCFLAEQ